MNYKRIYGCINTFRKTGDNIYIDEIEKILDDTIREEAAKKNGKKNQYSGLKNILKRADVFFNYPVQVENKYLFCDGYCMAILNTDYNFEMLPDEYEGKKQTATNLFNSYKNKLNIDNLISFDLPHIDELKAEKKILKSKYKSSNGAYKYDFGEGLPLVNIDYLIDMINIFSSDKAYIIKGQQFSPIYFIDSDNFGVLMPMRRTQQ